MYRLALFLLVCACSLQYWTRVSGTGAPARHRRGVLDLVVTLWCYRDRLKVPLLGINLYGCYCGTGGAGAAVDDVDRCCLRHDCCYRYSRIDLRCHSKVKWQLYQFSCGPAHTQCHSSTLCGRMACECDKQFAECLTRAKPRRRHFFYNKKELCVGPHDVCPELHPNLTAISERSQDPTRPELGPAKSRKKRWRRRKTTAKEKKKAVGRPALWM
ncbi:phospholipase A2, minor isoenzyme-like [Phyllobates terribilis]|uniref:phospholipase A2, minor isoenzyme-like n=1 Tax=Phyllobates terribilis TaxID=111132 RepID=UPI003CCAE52F